MVASNVASFYPLTKVQSNQDSAVKPTNYEKPLTKMFDEFLNTYKVVVYVSFGAFAPV